MLGASGWAGRSPRSWRLLSLGWPGLQGFLAHQTGDSLATNVIAPGQQIRPDTPHTVRVTAVREATADLSDQHLILPLPFTGRSE